MRLLMTALLFGALSEASAAPHLARQLQEEFNAVVAGARPAVVNISTVREERVRLGSPHFFFGDPEDWLFEQFHEGRRRGEVFRHRSEGVGSGFILSEKGEVLTNDHVVRGATEIRVVLSHAGGKEETLKGRVVGRDAYLDLALVQIEASRSFPHVTLGDSDKVRVGDWAIAIGSPFALQQTVTAGIISAVRQSVPIEGRLYRNLLQTDAAINRGNSGGPLINLDGEVVGVNTAIFSPSGAFSGVGFAIPANEVKVALEYLRAGKQARHGWLGVEVSPVDQVYQERMGLPKAEGVLVQGVVPGGPSEKAGLKRGDVITRVDGEDVSSPQELIARITRRKAGDSVSVEAFRRAERRTFLVKLGERPEEAEAGPAAEEEGAEEGGGKARGSFRWEGAEFEPAEGGARVARLEPSSPLNGTLLPGDVVRGVDGAEARDLKSLEAACRKARLPAGVVFDLIRRGRPLFVSVKTG